MLIPVYYDRDREGQDKHSYESTEASNDLKTNVGLLWSDDCNALRLHLASPGVGRPGPVAHRGENHQAPPEAVHEGPLGYRVLLGEVD